MNHGKHENTWISYDLLMINGLQGIPMGKHLKHMKNQKLSCPETKSQMDSASLFMRGPTSGWNCSCKSVVSWAYILILVVSSTQYIVIPCYTMLYHVIPCYTHGVYPNCTFKCQNPWIMVMSHEGENCESTSSLGIINAEHGPEIVRQFTTVLKIAKKSSSQTGSHCQKVMA